MQKIIFALQKAFLTLFPFLLLMTPAHAQEITLCKGVTIPDGYTIIKETTSPDCPNEAYSIKKTASAKPTPISPAAPASSPTPSGQQDNDLQKLLDDATKIKIGPIGTTWE